MKKLIALLTKLIPYDKLLHFVSCYTALLGAFLASRYCAQIDPFASLTFGTGFSAGLGIGKEFGDARSPGNKWSNGDIIADAAGIVAGIITVVMIFF